jgi:anti-anti-sigma factor
MSEPLSVELGSFGSVQLIRLRGDLCYGQNLTAVHDVVSELRRTGHDRLIVDLGAVRALDSSGFSALLDIRRTFGDSRDHVILLRPSDRVRGALAAMRVASLFAVVDDEADLPERIGGRVTPPAHRERRLS